MSYEETKSGGTAVSSARPDANPWTNVTNVLSDDTNRATCSTPKGDSTDYIDVTNFGFDITHGSTIDGIVVSVRRITNGVICTDNVMSLIVGGTAQGNNKASGSLWETSLSTVTYGTSTDLWGLSLTWENVVASNFGFRFAGENNGLEGCSIGCEYISITVYYTPPVGRQKSVTKGIYLGTSRGML